MTPNNQPKPNPEGQDEETYGIEWTIDGLTKDQYDEWINKITDAGFTPVTTKKVAAEVVKPDEKDKPDCSQHKKDLFGEADMKVVAEMVGNLNYKTLAMLLTDLQNKIFKDSLKDKAAGRIRLSDALMQLSLDINDASYKCERAWQISKPFMDKNN